MRMFLYSVILCHTVLKKNVQHWSKHLNKLVKTITRGELSATGDQQRKTRSRIQKKAKTLADDHIEVTTSVSAADAIVSKRFPRYTGKALKSRIRSLSGVTSKP